MKTELTKEQSQHLIDLGVPKEKASEIIQEYVIDEYYPSYLDRPKRRTAHVTRIFKLEDFLNGEILPKEIVGGWGLPARLSMTVSKNLWYTCYNFIEGSSFSEEELVDALYKLACWYYGEFLKSKKDESRKEI